MSFLSVIKDLDIHDSQQQRDNETNQAKYAAVRVRKATANADLLLPQLVHTKNVCYSRNTLVWT